MKFTFLPRQHLTTSETLGMFCTGSQEAVAGRQPKPDRQLGGETGAPRQGRASKLPCKTHSSPSWNQPPPSCLAKLPQKNLKRPQKRPQPPSSQFRPSRVAGRRCGHCGASHPCPDLRARAFLMATNIPAMTHFLRWTGPRKESELFYLPLRWLSSKRFQAQELGSETSLPTHGLICQLICAEKDEASKKPGRNVP